MSELNENEKRFLVGLEKLSRETGVIIGGCGCCGSPFLVTDEDVFSPNAGYGIGHAGEVSWISPDNECKWKNFRRSIVKGESE